MEIDCFPWSHFLENSLRLQPTVAQNLVAEAVVGLALRDLVVLARQDLLHTDLLEAGSGALHLVQLSHQNDTFAPDDVNASLDVPIRTPNKYALDRILNKHVTELIKRSQIANEFPPVSQDNNDLFINILN